MQNGVCGIDSERSAVSTLTIMKEHVIQCIGWFLEFLDNGGLGTEDVAIFGFVYTCNAY